MKSNKILKELAYNFKHNISDEQFEKISEMVKNIGIDENAIIACDCVSVKNDNLDILESFQRAINDYLYLENIDFDAIFSISTSFDMENEVTLDYLNSFLKPSTEELNFTCCVIKFVCNDKNNYFLFSLTAISTNSLLLDISDVIDVKNYDLNKNYIAMQNMMNKVIKY